MNRNTKFNRILSSVLVVIMMFTCVVALIPTKTSAAYGGSSTAKVETLTSDEVKEIVRAAAKYSFSSAEEMLNYEIEQGYLDSVNSADGKFSIYVNRYTGVMYYVNNVTGQILTSNPYNYDASDDTTDKMLLSQILVEFTEIATSKKMEYNSTDWAALYTQITTSYIDGGIRVKYTLGDTTARFLLPGRIKASKFEEMVLYPMINNFIALMEDHCSEAYPDTEFNVFEIEKYNMYDEVEEFDLASKNNIVFYGTLNSRPLKNYLSEMSKIFKDVFKGKTNTPEYKQLNTLSTNIIQIIGAYSLQNLQTYKSTSTNYENMYNDYYVPQEGVDKNLEIFTTLEPMYTLPKELTVNKKRNYANVIRPYLEGYTFSEMFADEKECGHVEQMDQKPVIRCALEYTFNEDGSLSVRLPANSISFDDTVYNFGKITPLKFFGVGDLKEDGYIFYPDGSGAIVEFDDFYNEVDKTSTYDYETPYGKDFAYSNITGAHREQITMPVYGVVADTNANKTTQDKYGVDKVTNGYFAIIEEGASLATIGFETGGARYNYGGAFCWYSPYPSDVYDLSETISVGNASSYTIVSDCDYNGSYVTKIVMLNDETVGNLEYGAGKYYDSSYVGMANLYRNYLESNGLISPLETISLGLPLYIEALGSMEIVKKVLSFPVTQKISLTQFEQITEMYNELIDAVTKFTRTAEEYEAKANAETDEVLKAQYTATAQAYRDLVTRVDTIDNINFRLTGFGNGGMYYTYPTKVRWDKACGGRRQFNKLISTSKDVNASGNANFGVYPEFDFMYINNTETFDGVRIRNNVSKMVDNRYASKQEYDSVLQEYVSHFALVVNPESLDKLYSKFAKKIAKYDLDSISVSTLGSNLNSNFDEDQPVNRNDAEKYVTAVLDKMKNEAGFDIMLDAGNIYSVKYATHILNASIDSSHIAYASYTIPFTGMVLHGYVNYAGSAANYSGTPDYELLRSIESGASLYYVLCYENAEYLKEDMVLSNYYGVNYSTWYESIVTNYTRLNKAIGDLQNYKIVDHKIILGERVITETEVANNYKLLKAELLEMLEAQIAEAVANGYKDLSETESSYGRNLAVIITADDRNALVAQFADILQLSVEEIEGTEFAAEIDKIIAYYNAEYASKDAATDYVVTLNSIVYESKYAFITDSNADAGDDYKFTDYTSDVDNIAIVTYSNGTDTVKFVLNYNMYNVKVIIDGVELPEISEYGCIRIDKEGVKVL